MNACFLRRVGEGQLFGEPVPVSEFWHNGQVSIFPPILILQFMHVFIANSQFKKNKLILDSMDYLCGIQAYFATCFLYVAQ